MALHPFLAGPQRLNDLTIKVGGYSKELVPRLTASSHAFDDSLFPYGTVTIKTRNRTLAFRAEVRGTQTNTRQTLPSRHQPGTPPPSPTRSTRHHL